MKLKQEYIYRPNIKNFVFFSVFGITPRQEIPNFFFLPSFNLVDRFAAFYGFSNLYELFNNETDFAL